MARANRYITAGRIYHITHRCQRTSLGELRRTSDRSFLLKFRRDRDLYRSIDLNMVRAGVVEHPSDWPWCGYHELVGSRSRYRLLDRRQVIQGLGDGYDEPSVPVRYAQSMGASSLAGGLVREPMWTEAVAKTSSEPWKRLSRTVERPKSKRPPTSPEVGSSANASLATLRGRLRAPNQKLRRRSSA
jgi:hypothetical protein